MRIQSRLEGILLLKNTFLLKTRSFSIKSVLHNTVLIFMFSRWGFCMFKFFKYLQLVWAFLLVTSWGVRQTRAPRLRQRPPAAAPPWSRPQALSRPALWSLWPVSPFGCRLPNVCVSRQNRRHGGQVSLYSFSPVRLKVPCLQWVLD